MFRSAVSSVAEGFGEIIMFCLSGCIFRFLSGVDENDEKMKETIEKTCICGIRISFDQKILSQYKNFDGGKINLKPIEILN